MERWRNTKSALRRRADTGGIPPSTDSHEFWRYFSQCVGLLQRVEDALDERERRGANVEAYRAKMPRVWRAVIAPSEGWDTRHAGGGQDDFPESELSTLTIMSEALNNTQAAHEVGFNARLDLVRKRTLGCAGGG
jgi:hypothetical protein